MFSSPKRERSHASSGREDEVRQKAQVLFLNEDG